MELIEKNPEDIKNLFNKIAHNYDRNNTIMSLGLHTVIKKAAIRSLGVEDGEKILDLCSGTGDIAGFIKEAYPNANVIGLDFSENMLEIARKKFPEIEFLQGSATELPFEEKSFDKVTMSFGLRNIKDYKKALTECARVLKTDGEFLHLDFGLKSFSSKVFDVIVMSICQIVFGDKNSYNYLLKSKQKFFHPQTLIEEVEAVGFRLKLRKDFLFGAISAQIFVRNNPK